MKKAELNRKIARVVEERRFKLIEHELDTMMQMAEEEKEIRIKILTLKGELIARTST